MKKTKKNDDRSIIKRNVVLVLVLKKNKFNLSRTLTQRVKELAFHQTLTEWLSTTNWDNNANCNRTVINGILVNSQKEPTSCEPRMLQVYLWGQRPLSFSKRKEKRNIKKAPIGRLFLVENIARITSKSSYMLFFLRIFFAFFRFQGAILPLLKKSRCTQKTPSIQIIISISSSMQCPN